MDASGKRRKTSHVSSIVHEAHSKLCRIEEDHLVERKTSDQNGGDGRRKENAHRRSLVLEQYTHEGRLELWELALSNPIRRVLCINSYCQAECWLWTSHKKSGKGGSHDSRIPPFTSEHGYGVISRGKGRGKIKVIQLACYSKFGKVVLYGENASHLCHNPACINPDHLVIESAHKNNIRVGCPCWSHSTNGEKQSICPHAPQCLCPDLKGLMDKQKEHAPDVPHGWRWIARLSEVETGLTACSSTASSPSSTTSRSTPQSSSSSSIRRFFTASSRLEFVDLTDS